MTCNTWLRSGMLALYLTAGLSSVASAQSNDENNALQSTAEAPPGMRSLGSTLGGAFFVAEDLLNRQEAIKAQVLRIREDIASGNISGAAAMESLAAIEEELTRLRGELEAKKTLVSAFQVYSKTTEETFPLGDQRLVIITGDDVIIRGWDGPGIKCVVKKSILAKQPPEASEFDSIQVDHQIKFAEEKVGLTREQRDQQEREFLESEQGRKLSDQQKASRKALVDEIHHSYDAYTAFQGREANTIQLTGLTHEDGNRQLSLRINSPGGGGLRSSQWQRHASMTVYIPACESVAVRGCLAGLDIQSIQCDLVLTTHDSRERDYDGSFQVRGVKGNVNIDQVPVHLLSQVTGNVHFTATNEFVNRGTLHVDDRRIYSTYETHSTRIDQIGGSLRARFLRTDLRLVGIVGGIDVVNEYGDTQLSLAAPHSEGAQRIISESGRIAVEGHAEVLTAMPIYAFTQCGHLETNLSRESLDDVDFSTGHPTRGWRGFVTPSEDRFDVTRFERPAAALENRSRPAGLDLISNSGRVTVLAAADAQ